MPLYRVGLTQTVVEGTTVYVDAPSEQEAGQLAIKKANAGEVDWKFLDAVDEVEIATLDEVPARPSSHQT